MTNNPKEMLDDYLMGRLNPEEVSSFEKLLVSDPILAKEAQLQKDIIAGISEARRAAMKARLNNIEIPKTVWYTNPKTLGFSFAAMVVAILAFLLLPSKDNTPSATQTTQVVQAPQTPSTTENGPEIEAIKPQNEKLPKEAVATTNKQKNVSAPEKLKQNQLATTNEPSINIGTDNDESNHKKADEVEALNAPTSAASGTKTLNTETISDSPTFTYHYKRNDTRLTLYGNFSEKTYEVIEINGKNGISFYLYHNGSYFALPITGTEIKALSPLSDEALTTKLANLRKRK